MSDPVAGTAAGIVDLYDRRASDWIADRGAVLTDTDSPERCDGGSLTPTPSFRLKARSRWCEVFMHRSRERRFCRARDRL